MRSILVVAQVVAFVVLSQSVGHALWTFTNSGSWPKSWPGQLEELRSQSRTFHHVTATAHEIPFSERAQFESAWPHIISLASKGAPVTLVHKRGVGTNADAEAGVRITTPNTGERIVPGDKVTTTYLPGLFSRLQDDELDMLEGSFLTVGPPWPDEIQSDSGDLPEFVVADGFKWRATTVKELRENRKPRRNILRRSRTEITLIVDGKIVDLNRIRLPAFVIDKRFEEQDGRP